MHHVYRQISALRRCRSMVLTQKREEAETFPFAPLHLVRHSPWRFLSREWNRHVTHLPWQITSAETRRILAVLDREKADVLHIFFGTTAIHLLPLLRNLSIPVVVSFHGADVAGEMRTPSYRPILAEIFNRASAITARSQALADAVKQMGAPEEKISLQRTFLPKTEGCDRLAPIDGRWQLLQAARLVPKKGLITALKVFAKFVQDHPWAHFVIAGEGPMREELQELVRQLGIAGNVSLTGFLSQEALRQKMHESHIYFHPAETVGGSDQEGVPNAMLEAMATGLPVVSTLHGGIPEVVREGVEGFLAKEGDGKALEELLRQCTSHPEKFTAMSQAAQKRVESLFGREAADQMEEVYLRLADRNAKFPFTL